MSTFKQVYDIRNLRRAYRWMLSYPDARYKGYFRDDYSAYALSSELNLKFLSRRMRQGTFEPSNACKIYVPKASGILRPITLLTINDQIAYQACVNVIAEALQRQIAKRHGKTVFYHQYAGRTSAFFYKRWEDCYAQYANAIRASYHSGLEYVATFDLTAFYDSIDHQVLNYFLQRSRIDPDTSAFLIKALQQWSEATWSWGRKKANISGTWYTPRSCSIWNAV